MNTGDPTGPSIISPPVEPNTLDVEDANSPPRKTCRSKRIVCVIEKLNMVFLIFFVCYLSWTIPANYGLFTSNKAANNNASVTGSNSKIQVDEMNSTERKLLNFTGFHIERFERPPPGRRYSFKKRKKDKDRDKKNQNNFVRLENNELIDKNNARINHIDDKKYIKNKNKDIFKKKSRRKNKNKWKNQNELLEPTTIRHIIEQVAQEALSKGGNWDTNNNNGAPIVSLSFGTGDDEHQMPPKVESEKKSDVNIKDKKPLKRKRPKKKNKRKWSNWGPCSVTCGVGERVRSRKCGMTCKEVESMICFMPACLGKPNPDTTNLNSYYVWESENFIPKPMDIDYIDPEVDNCGKWMECNKESVSKYFGKSDLPSCPCKYPVHLAYNKKVWDDTKQRHYLWMEANSPEEAVAMYKPQAKHCIRSQLIPGTLTLAAQHCCYDSETRLITRGKSAGTPNLISPEISPELHQKVDISPWIICKGDWTRYNEIIPPNNVQECTDNPNNEEFSLEIQMAKDF